MQQDGSAGKWSGCRQRTGGNMCPGVTPNMFAPGLDELGKERMSPSLSQKGAKP